MSLAVQPLIPILELDKITNVDELKAISINSGGDRISYQSWSSSSISNTGIQVICNPPSASTFVDRMVQMTIPIRLSFTSTISTNNALFTPATPTLVAGRDAPRAWPVAGSCESIRVQINNTSVSLPISQLIHPLMQYGDVGNCREREWSLTPNMVDQSSNYSDLVGTNRNPLGIYGDAKQDQILPRGATKWTIVSNPTVVPTLGGVASTAVVDMLVTEYIMLSPFYFQEICKNNNGFYNVNAMQLDLAFMTHGFRAWSHTDGPSVVQGADAVTVNITNVAMALTGFVGFSYAQSTPTFTFKYISPNQLDQQNLAPNKPLSYGYSDIQVFPQDAQTIAYNTTKTIVSNALQLNQIPDKMFCLIRPSRQYLESRCNLTDTFLPITQVSVQFGNASVLLSTANQQSLYAIAVRNGYQGSYNQFSGQEVYGPTLASRYSCGGAAVCLRFGKDIQLQPTECPGMIGSYMLQVQVQCTNLNSSGKLDAIPMEFALIVVNGGVFSILGVGSAVNQLGVITPQDVLSAQEMPGITRELEDDVRGSGLGDWLSSFGSRVNDFLKQSKLGSVLAKNIPVVGPALGEVVGNLGYGYSNGRGLIGGCNDCPSTPGASIGGRMVTKKQLKNSLAYR